MQGNVRVCQSYLVYWRNKNYCTNTHSITLESSHVQEIHSRKFDAFGDYLKKIVSGYVHIRSRPCRHASDFQNMLDIC